MKICYASLTPKRDEAPEKNLWLVEDSGAINLAEVASSEGLDVSRRFGEIDSFLSEGGLGLVAEWKASDILARFQQVPVKALHLDAPISRRSKILCAAYNYRSHVAEAGEKQPSAPFLFLKPTSAVAGPYDDIIKPRASRKMDYEIELAVIISKRVKNVEPDQAHDAIAGYFVANDVSFRDFQFNELNLDLSDQGKNWTLGKGMDTAFPAGPWLVTVDEAGSGPFDLECRVNGKRVQQGNTKDMIFDIPHLVSRASIGTTLYPGDVISTGTPAGVAYRGGFRYLQPGDVVEGTISSIGTIRSRVVAEPA